MPFRHGAEASTRRADFANLPKCVARHCHAWIVSGRQKRLKAELTLGSVSCLTFVFGVIAWPGIALTSLGSSPTLAAAWWSCLLVGAALGVSACRIDNDSEEPHYLSSIVAGLRREWRNASIRH